MEAVALYWHAVTLLAYAYAALLMFVATWKLGFAGQKCIMR